MIICTRTTQQYSYHEEMSLVKRRIQVNRVREPKGLTRVGCLATLEIKFDCSTVNSFVKNFVDHSMIGTLGVSFLHSHRKLKSSEKHSMVVRVWIFAFLHRFVAQKLRLFEFVWAYDRTIARLHHREAKTQTKRENQAPVLSTGNYWPCYVIIFASCYNHFYYQIWRYILTRLYNHNTNLQTNTNHDSFASHYSSYY